MDFPGDSVVKNPPANEGDTGDAQFNPWVGNTPWRRKEPTPVFVPGNAMGRGAWPATEHGGGKGVREDSATKTNNLHSVVIYIHVLLVLSLWSIDSPIPEPSLHHFYIEGSQHRVMSCAG